MKIPFRPVRQQQSAMALLIVMGFLVAALILFGSFMYWVSSNAKVTTRNNEFLGSEYAAEAGSEMILAQMEQDFLNQSLTNASFYSTFLPSQTNWPIQYVFSDTNGVKNQVSIYIGAIPAVTEPLNSQFAGLFGFPQQVIITATAQPIGQAYNVPATIQQSVQFASIPCFQFAIFYNINLEIDPGSAMTVKGPVFSNAGIWGGTKNLTFSSRVTAVGQVNITSVDPFCSGKTDGNAPPIFSLAGQPTSGADALTLPIGTGVSTNSSATNAEAILNLSPPDYASGSDAAYSTNGLVYNFNACDLIISNSISGTNGYLGTNITITYQDAFNVPYLTKLTNNEICTFQRTNGSTNLPALWTTNGPNRPTTNYTLVASRFSWVSNVVFWDYREVKYVQAVQIDVGQFNAWLNDTNHQGYRWNAVCGSHKSHHIDSICVYNSVPLTNNANTALSKLPAVRISNGKQLYGKYGLTVSTPQPLYVYGNLNTTTNGTVVSQALGDTTNSWPCAVMGDAITILSSSWSDANYTPSTAVSGRTPVATYINAAALEGIVQSTNSSYSGGVENFLRLLENWTSSISLTYNGSIVVLFPSIYATNYWSGNAYGVPKRDWGFDVNFNQQAKLPPMCPQSKAVIRGQWTGF